jgi:hypothetical protein
MKSFRQVRETSTASSSIVPQWLHKIAMKPKLKDMVKGYLRWRRKNPGQGRGGVQQAVKMMGLSPRDGNLLIDTLNDMVKQGKLPKHLALEACCSDCETDQWYKDQPEWGTDASSKKAKKVTPGQKESVMPTTAQIRLGRAAKKAGVGKNDDFYNQHRDPEKVKAEKEKQKRPAPMQVKKPVGSFKWFATRDMKK